MSRYTCPCCGTGRWHATGCREVPEEVRTTFGYDEANRDPMIGHELASVVADARRLTGQPPMTVQERETFARPAPSSAKTGSSQFQVAPNLDPTTAQEG